MGRPRLADDIKKRSLTIRVAPAIIDDVRAAGGENMSQVVEAGLKLWLEQRPKPKRKARRKVPA
jgi:hypothetical protein